MNIYNYKTMRPLFEIYEDHLVIQYVDSKSQVFKCIIPKTDFFVSQHLKGNVAILKNMLEENYFIKERNSTCVIEISEPISLRYELTKIDLKLNQDISVFIHPDNHTKEIQKMQQIIKDFEKQILELREENKRILSDFSHINNQHKHNFTNINKLFNIVNSIQRRFGNNDRD